MKYILPLFVLLSFSITNGFSQVSNYNDSITRYFNGCCNCFGIKDQETKRIIDSPDFIGTIKIEALLDSSNSPKFLRLIDGNICLKKMNSRCYGYNLKDKETPKEFEASITTIKDEIRNLKFSISQDPKCSRRRIFDVSYKLK